MAATLIDGHRTWSGSRDSEGYRSYKIKHLVKTATTDGPNVVMNCPGLPLPGSVWDFDDDLDIWAFCYPTMKVLIHKEKEGDPNRWWTVEQEFSTKPMKRCNDTEVEDPLMEPDRVSGSFVKYVRELMYDRNGDMIKTSSHEIIRGPQVEFDANRPAVHIEQNVSDLELDVLSELADNLNDAPLWGLPARCIKFTPGPWERNVYGTCNYYYTRSLDFDINFNTFDRDVLDEGTKALSGDWDTNTGLWVLKDIGGSAPDPDNPTHFNRYKDKNGENARVVLDGAGKPYTGSGVGTSDPPGSIHIEGYPETNLLVLGIPTSF